MTQESEVEIADIAYGRPGDGAVVVTFEGGEL